MGVSFQEVSQRQKQFFFSRSLWWRLWAWLEGEKLAEKMSPAMTELMEQDKRNGQNRVTPALVWRVASALGSIGPPGEREDVEASPWGKVLKVQDVTSLAGCCVEEVHGSSASLLCCEHQPETRAPGVGGCGADKGFKFSPERYGTQE